MIDADDSGTDNNLDNQDLILSIQDGPGVGVLGRATPVPFLVTLPGLVGKKKKIKTQHVKTAYFRGMEIVLGVEM